MYFSSTLYHLNYIHIYSIAMYAAPCNAVSPKVHRSYIYVLQYTYVLQQRADLCEIRIIHIYVESHIYAAPCNAVSSRINCAYTYVVQYICIVYIHDSETYVEYICNSEILNTFLYTCVLQQRADLWEIRIINIFWTISIYAQSNSDESARWLVRIFFQKYVS